MHSPCFSSPRDWRQVGYNLLHQLDASCGYQCLGSALSEFPFSAKSPTYACYLLSIRARTLLIHVTALSFALTSPRSKENNILFAFQALSSM